MKARATLGAALGIVVATVLAGCLPTAPNVEPTTEVSDMSAENARDELRAVVEELKAIAGGGTWEASVDGARPCDLGDGSTGAQFPVFTMSGEGASDVAGSLEAMKAAFAERGYTPVDEREDVSGLSITYLGELGFTMQYRVATDRRVLSATTTCVVGDSGEINERLAD